MLWDFFDLITFGAFEKKAKKKKEYTGSNNNQTNSNSTQPVLVKEVKVVEYRDK